MALKLIPENVKRIQNLSGQDVVPVLATYNTNGQIRPLYVRINGIVYKILTCQRWSTGEMPTDIFRCTIADHGTKRMIILTFYPQETIWTLKR